MTTPRPESRYHSKAGVLMSQPLKSSWARRPSSRYTAGALAPPLWNSTLMSRPIPADGTIRYSTGRPGREKAPAVAEPPTALTRPGSTAAARTATVTRRGSALAAPRILPTNFMLHLSHLSYAAPEITRPTRLGCPCSQPHLGVISLLSFRPPWSPPQPLRVVIRSDLRACSCAPQYGHAWFPAAGNWKVALLPPALV